MIRSTLSLLAVSFAVAALAGCSKEEEKDPTTGTKGAGETNESTDPTETEEEESVGPQCAAYVACCEEIAEEQPALAGSCDSMKDNIATAVDKGASTATYESACKQGLKSMQQAGYCK